MFSVPTRAPFAELSATEYETTPLPVPLVGDVMLNQLALLIACQVQPVEVMETVPVPPGMAKLCEVGEIEFETSVLAET